MMGMIGRRRPATLVTSLAVVLACGLVATGGRAAGATGARAELAAGQTGARSAVPWNRVGPGWVLAESWFGRSAPHPKAAPARIYLIDPAGGRYLVERITPTPNPPVLADWSGDKTRALLRTGDPRLMWQLTLATGQISQFLMPRGVTVVGYTRPDGLNLLGVRAASSTRTALLRYNLTGQLQKRLGTVLDTGNPIYAPSGQVLAAAAAGGLELVSNAGGVARRLPVRGVGAGGCGPARWWNATTVLAVCAGSKPAFRPRLWLVPASGRRARALTPSRGVHSRDLGDLDAWRLPSGLYLQSEGPCGTLVINRQARNGSVRQVTVPFPGDNDIIQGAYRDQLLVTVPDGCRAGSSLMWFNPATRHLNVLFRSGVISEAPYGEPFVKY
jgi:hypothetical protein